jgi:predicted aspartyl protease
MGRYDAGLVSCGFAIGSTSYQDHYPGDPRNPRIVVSVATERDSVGEQTTQMILDTGATWCVLHPEIAESWGLYPSDDDLPQQYRVQGILYDGHLVRARIRLLASHGQSLAAEVTFFIPNSDNGEQWNLPNFLGYEAFLTRVRIGIDAQENFLYFGSEMDG